MRALLKAWRFAKLLREYVNEDTTWNEGNARDFAAFLNTDTGQLWMKRLRKRVFVAAIKATQATSDHSYHLGIARGIALNVSAIQDDYTPALKQQEEAEQETVMPVNASGLASLLSP